MEILKNILLDFKNTFLNIFHKIMNLKRRTRIGIILLIIASLGFYFLINGEANLKTETLDKANVFVTLKPVNEFNREDNFSTVGKVEAVSEANLQTESGGRVTNVYVNIGDRVPAGKIIASLQNDLQRASLLQAEGAYEAATVAAAQGNIGVNQSENSMVNVLNNAISVNRSAFNTANSIILNSLDQFYSNPTAGIIGLRLNGDTSYFNGERVYFRSSLASWSRSTLAPITEENLITVIDEAISNTTRLRNLVTAFIAIMTSRPDTETFNYQLLSTYTPALLSNESALNTSLTNLSNIKTAFKSAEDSREQAILTGGKTDGVSGAQAQLKVALGQLRAAQANYEKTLVRSPISGVVNALYLKSGDYVAPGQPAVVIANNNGLQIKAYVSQSDSLDLEIGDVVKIDDKATGTIVAKGGAIDPSNGKVEIKINVTKTNLITNGSTVHLSFNKRPSNHLATEIIIPLTALKLTATGANVFIVDGENKLQALPVTLGEIRGENVEITTGLNNDSVIVVDARGLKAGAPVQIN